MFKYTSVLHHSTIFDAQNDRGNWHTSMSRLRSSESKQYSMSVVSCMI